MMLEISSLLLNMAALSESKEPISTLLNTDFLLDPKETTLENQESLDPSSFILLMDQILNPKPLPKDITNLNEAVTKTITEDSTLEKEEINQDSKEFLDNQSAMIWINSESYEPPKAQAFQRPEKWVADMEPKTFELTQDKPQAIFDKEMSTSNNLTSVIKVDKAPDSSEFIPNLKLKETVEVKQDTPKINPETLKMIESLPKDFERHLKYEEREISQGSTQKIEEIQQGKSFVVENLRLNSKDLSLKSTQIRTEKSEFTVKDVSFKDVLIANEASLSYSKETDIPASTAVLNLASKELGLSEKFSMESKGIDSKTIDSQVMVLPGTTVKIEPQPIKPQDLVVNFTKPQWENQLAEGVVWCKDQGIQNAHLKIHPEELGPLEINIKMVDNQASVSITSHSSQVREMMNEALPQLRELMTEQGLNLSEVSIESHSKSNHSSQERAYPEQNLNSLEEEKAAPPTKAKASKGLVDYFA